MLTDVLNNQLTKKKREKKYCHHTTDIKNSTVDNIQAGQ